MRRTSSLVVFAMVMSLAVLHVAETAAQVAPSSAEPFRLPASERPNYLPWIKLCWQAEEKNCSTRSDGRLRNGATTVSVTLFERSGKSDKILRITLPHNLMIGPGTRLFIDAGDPVRGAFVSCVPEGCVADYTAADEMIEKLKNGRYLIVQAMHVTGKTINWMVPVSDFGNAYDGPPADLKKFWSIYESPSKSGESTLKPWKDDTLQPHLRPGRN